VAARVGLDGDGLRPDRHGAEIPLTESREIRYFLRLVRTYFRGRRLPGVIEERQRKFRTLLAVAEPRPASDSLMPSQTMRAHGARTRRTAGDRSPRRCSR
jgi:hypothetical protein